MTELFQADVPERYIARVLDVMRAASHHTCRVLTKRAERMRLVTRSGIRGLDGHQRAATP